MREIRCQPLNPHDFAPYGDVLDARGVPDKVINQGFCGRFHDRATLDFGPDARAGLSIFKAIARKFPYSVDLVERHPDGSQAFVPMTDDPFLVIVADDAGGKPGCPRAFITDGAQAINFHRNTWHGVLTPLAEPGLFAVIDRIGTTPNLEEYVYDTPYTILPA